MGTRWCGWTRGALLLLLAAPATAEESRAPLLVRVEDGAGTRLELAHAPDARRVKLCVGPALGARRTGELGLDPLSALAARAGPLGVVRWDVPGDVGRTGLAAQALVVGGDGRVALSNVVALARSSAANAGAGRVVLTELMVDPVAVPDAVGEWLELTSRAPCRLDLTGWSLSDGGRDHHRITGRTGGGPLWIGPGERLVLGNSHDHARNGGVRVDHVVERFVLANDADTVRLADRSGAIVDEVVYDARTWRLRPGRSIGFTADADARGDPTSWCPSTSELPSGDRGTPGAANDACDG